MTAAEYVVVVVMNEGSMLRGSVLMPHTQVRIVITTPFYAFSVIIILNLFLSCSIVAGPSQGNVNHPTKIIKN